MTRYTTPTFSLTVPDTVDLTEADNVYATFASSGYKVTKTGEEIEVTANQVDVYFSQAETGAIPAGTLRIKLNWTYQQGGKVKRACSTTGTIDVDDNLLNEVVE